MAARSSKYKEKSTDGKDVGPTTWDVTALRPRGTLVADETWVQLFHINGAAVLPGQFDRWQDLSRRLPNVCCGVPLVVYGLVVRVIDPTAVAVAVVNGGEQDPAASATVLNFCNIWVRPVPIADVPDVVLACIGAFMSGAPKE